MKWSVKIGRIAGIDVHMHLTFLLLKALARQDTRTTVASIIRRETAAVDSTEMLDTVVSKLNECECDLLPVTREGELVGVVTTDNLGAFMRLRDAAAS